MKKIGLIAALMFAAGCDVRFSSNSAPKSASGVQQATAHVETNPSSGMTVEQENVVRRLSNDNKPGAIKHLYIISPFTGDVLIYSAVKGKVTSGGKRLTPKTVTSTDGEFVDGDLRGIAVDIGGYHRRTSEVIQDDGTYGDSVEYIFWWDTKGVYHQQGIEGSIWHVSDQPLAVNKALITIDSGK